MANLTSAQIEVLHAAGFGDLYRSESIHDLYKSYVRGRNVTPIVRRLTDREVPLLQIGDRDPDRRLTRRWDLTDAGREALATMPTKAEGN